MGCNGGKGGAPIVMNDAMAAMNGATSDERGRNRRGLRPPQPLQRNKGIRLLSNARAHVPKDSELRIRQADHAMRETADEKKRRRRRYPDTAESTGKHLVMTELLRRGFEAEFARASYEKHDMLVWVRESPPKPIRVTTVHSAPWYVRWDLFAKRADQVTVYVLLGAGGVTAARFFVVKNSDLATHLRQPPTWKAFGFIDVQSVEKYENNWDLLR
jgi:hypothetical protein